MLHELLGSKLHKQNLELGNSLGWNDSGNAVQGRTEAGDCYPQRRLLESCQGQVFSSKELVADDETKKIKNLVGRAVTVIIV